MRPAFALLLAACLAAPPVSATCTIGRAAIVPLTVQSGRAIIDISMNGHPGKFEVDTGAAETLLDPTYAQDAHVGLDRNAGQLVMVGAGGHQSLRIWRAHVRQTQIGGLKFPDWEYAVLDGPLPSQFHVDGLLGTDFMHYFDIELDGPAGQMTIWRLSDCKDVRPAWAGDFDAIGLKPTKGQKLSMPIWIDNAFLDVLFDTGAGGLLLTRDAANRAGATDQALDRDRASNGKGVGGAFDVSVHRFHTLLVGSGVFNNPEIAVDAHPLRGNGDTYDGRDGILGLRLLLADKIWISFGTDTLFLQTPQQATQKPKSP
jgi:predicted aspartyl protease